MNDCCLTPTQLFFFSYIIARTMIWWWSPLSTNTFSWMLIVLVHWNNSLRIDMSSTLEHIILIPSQPVFHLTS